MQFQFGISVALIAVTGIVYNQVDYARNKGLGFETEQTLYFRTGYPGVKDLSGPIEDAMRQVPGVVATSRFTQIPFSPYWSHRNVHLGHGDQGIQISSVGVDEGFVDLFAMKLQAGRNIQMGVRGEVIINETAVRSFGYADPSQVIGLPIDVTWRKEGTVVGVVEDFHFESIRHKISPVALYGRGDGNPSFTGVRMYPEGVAQTLTSLQDTWHRLVPDYPFHSLPLL